MFGQTLPTTERLAVRRLSSYTHETTCGVPSLPRGLFVWRLLGVGDPSPPKAEGGQQPLKEPIVVLPVPPLDWDSTPAIGEILGNIGVAFLRHIGSARAPLEPVTVNTGGDGRCTVYGAVGGGCDARPLYRAQAPKNGSAFGRFRLIVGLS